jgi:uncharacterized membrane protein YeaQ/YmgE (transglycosylase-associated protein family)
MVTFADILLTPSGVIVWLLVGLIAGWLAGQVMKGGGYGVVGDIVVGLIGAVLGGLLFGMIGTGDAGLLGSILVAFLGACILIAVLRFVSGRRSRI